MLKFPQVLKSGYTEIHLLMVLMSAFLVYVHCTSVSPVLIKSLDFCVLIIFSCNLQGFLLAFLFLFL